MSEQRADDDPPAPINLADVRARQLLADSLARNKEGVALPTVANMLAILRHDPALRGLITLNEFTCETAILRAPPLPDDTARPMPGPYPRQWTEADEALILAYIQRTWTPRATDKAVRAAMTAESAMCGYHPVCDWLGTLQWDGTPRLDAWLTDAFGTPDAPYTRDIGSKFLIAAVRRVRQPGCKFDFMLVIEGAQGIGKSTAMKALFGAQWFSDSITHDLGHKDAAIGLIGVWCLEMPEIDQLIRNDVETIKAFLARSTDKYRPPFGRGDVTRHRQGVMCGTTNNAEYLRDATGNRRFWPATALKADLAWITANRDQLWAEAAARESTDEPIWLEDPDVQGVATKIQAARVTEDVWAAKITRFVQHLWHTTTPDVLETALGVPTKEQDRRVQMRVAAVLTTLGWVSKVRWTDGQSSRRWESPSREPRGCQESGGC